MNNITLSANKEEIDAARKVFQKRGTTINTEFRKWLKTETESDAKQRKTDILRAFDALPSLDIGRKLTRDEMNER